MKKWKVKMSNQSPNYPRPLADDEKSSPVMAYMQDALCWGDVITKEKILVSRWLRTQAVPESISFYNARTIIPATGATPTPLQFSELHIPTQEILAYHLIPPKQDPLDYDPKDPNSHLYPITTLVGKFRMDGYLYLSIHSNLARYLEIIHEDFTSLYNVEISCPQMPALGVMRASYVLIRRTVSIFAQRAS
jgi:hypothetical protein